MYLITNHWPIKILRYSTAISTVHENGTIDLFTVIIIKCTLFRTGIARTLETLSWITHLGASSITFWFLLWIEHSLSLRYIYDKKYIKTNSQTMLSQLKAATSNIPQMLCQQRKGIILFQPYKIGLVYNFITYSISMFVTKNLEVKRYESTIVRLRH